MHERSEQKNQIQRSVNARSVRQRQRSEQTKVRPEAKIQLTKTGLRTRKKTRGLTERWTSTEQQLFNKHVGNKVQEGANMLRYTGE